MAADTGQDLRSLYAEAGGTAAVFTAKVDDYVAARPGYPPALFTFLREVAGVPRGALVADVGAGTGLFTAGLLEHGWRVVAVEPNAGMRQAADARLGALPAYASRAGSAESLPLADGSVDLVTAAQAFHWFDAGRARAEFLRVLRPAAPVALVWSDRLLADPLHRALDAVFAEFGGARRQALVAQEARRDPASFFGPDPPAELRWPYRQRLSEAGLQSLVFSRSYMPPRDSEAGRAAAAAVARLFARFATDGLVDLRYLAVAHVGRPAVEAPRPP